MIRIRTFGGLSVTSSAGNHDLQPRRLAILALLDAAGDRGISRDSLLGFLWPESETAKGRHALTQALHTLRRELAEPDLVQGTSRISLNRKVVASDRSEFLDAVTRKDLESVVALYGGVFLDGFFVRNSGDFERWVEKERATLKQHYERALEILAKQAEGRGDSEQASGFWRRLGESDPLNSKAAEGLANALASLGDQPAALRALQAHALELRTQLGTSASPSTRSLEERLRGHPRNAAPPSGSADRSEPTSASPSAPSSGPASSPRRKALKRFAAVASLAVITVTGWILLSGEKTTSEEVAVIAVFPFAVSGPAGLEYLSSGVPDLMSRNLSGVTGLRIVDPRVVRASIREEWSPEKHDESISIARNLGASLVLVGHVIPSGNRLRITVTVWDTRSSSALLETSAEGPADSLFATTDRLATAILVTLQPGTSPRLTQSAAATTTSLPAFKAYLEADDFLQERNYHEAVASLEKAVTLDSTFALAWFRLSDAADWAGRPPLVAAAARRAVDLSARLRERDRLLVNGYAAWQRGASAEAESMLRELLRSHPDDVEAWYFLGEVLFHNNPLQGRSMTEALGPFQRVVALEPRNGSAWSHLERVIALERKWDELEPIYRHLLELKQFEPNPWSEALRADVAGRTADWDAGLTHLRTWDDQMISAMISRLAVYFARLPRAEMVSRILAEPERGPMTRAYAHMTLAELSLAQGRIRESRAHLADAAQLDPPRALEYRALLAFTPFLSLDTAETIALIQALGEPMAPRAPSIFFTSQDSVAGFLRPYLAALLGVRLGKAAPVEGARSSVSKLSDPDARAQANALLQSLDAAGAWQRRQFAVAISALEKVELATQLQSIKLPFGSRSWERFIRAEALHQMGRDDAAIGWYQSLSENTTYDLIFAAPADLQLARILRSRGELDRARARYQRFLSAWRDCDPELRPMVAAARKELAALNN